MKERIRELVKNKYVIAGSIATAAVVFIIILLLASKGCNGSKKSDKKEVNADVTTTEKEKKTTKKEEKETTQSEETTSPEETTLPEETSEEAAQTQSEETNNSTSGKSLSNQPVTQPATQPPASTAPVNTQPPATPAQEHTQPATVAQPITEGRKRTRNTATENNIWQYWQREFRMNIDAKLGNKDSGESQFSGELIEIAKKFCQGQYSRIELINQLSGKQKILTDHTDTSGNLVSAEMKVHRDGTNAIVKDVTGKTTEQMSRLIFEEIAEYYRTNHVRIRTLGDTYLDCFSFMDADYVEACAPLPEFFIYFQLYDETDGTTKMYLVYSYTPYYF